LNSRLAAILDRIVFVTRLALWLLIAAVAPAHAAAAAKPHPPPHPIASSTVDSATVGRTRHVQRAFADALELERRGDLRTAIGAYRAVVRADSAYPEANYRLGRLLESLDKLPDALTAYRAELRFHPGHAAAQRELGLTLARLGQTKPAIATLERLTRAQPTDDQAWQALGFVYSVAGRHADAETALRRAIAYAPDRASEHRDLAVLLAGLGRESDARAEYHAAIALDDADPATWTNLGNLEARSEHWSAALEAYRSGEAHDSTYALALQGEIVVLDHLEDRKGAAETARRWLHIRPDDHRARLEAVSRYHQLGQDDTALALAREGVARSPSSGDAHVVLSSVLDTQRRPREALHELRVAARLFRDPLNRGRVINMMRATMGALPESIRVLVRQDSVAELARRGARPR